MQSELDVGTQSNTGDPALRVPGRPHPQHDKSWDTGEVGKGGSSLALRASLRERKGGLSGHSIRQAETQAERARRRSTEV